MNEEIIITYEYKPQKKYMFFAWTKYKGDNLLGLSNESFEDAEKELISRINEKQKVQIPEPKTITIQTS